VEQKLDLFLRDCLTADRQIEEKDLQEHEITVPPTSMKNIIFEKGVAFQSQAITTSKQRVFFGAYSYMNSGGYVRPGVFVGRYCSIGRRVTLGAGMHRMTGVSTAPILRGRGNAYTEEQQIKAEIPPRRSTQGPHALTILENDVWVGDGAIILPGVRVGTGAVVGANSVVTRNVAAYSVVGGIPAKPLRARFSSAIAEKLLLSQYWEYPFALLKALPCANVFEFLDAFALSEVLPYQFETLEFS